MNKTELIEAVAEKAGMTKKNTEGCLSAFVDVVSGALAKGERVQWTGFGTFELKQRAARKGVNPATARSTAPSSIALYCPGSSAPPPSPHTM
jgi:DNA-binding protein HU-beta